jgi:hypothetical protein
VPVPVPVLVCSYPFILLWCGGRHLSRLAGLGAMEVAILIKNEKAKRKEKTHTSTRCQGEDGCVEDLEVTVEYNVECST